jgi:lipoic acid synthetase
LPPWIRVRVGSGGGCDEVADLLRELKLNTVCQSAGCPNRGECWQRRTATFMILGNACTRDCRFCSVMHDPAPPPPELDEPQRVAEAARRLGLRHAVVTSVTRDDLPDGGAAHFAAVVQALKTAVPGIGVEVLTPDFQGDETALRTVLAAGPAVFNHNLETVERLTCEIRSGADYRRSLAVLAAAVRIGGDRVRVKSGLMVGLGETDSEVEQAIRDLRAAGTSLLTVGQYLPPSRCHRPLDRYVTPEQFDAWRDFALALGFAHVAAAPLVRSSYHAEDMAAG